jgi:transcription elongation factor Elf1
MSDEFVIVEYLRCPHCRMVVDPKGMHIDNMDGMLTCRFCGERASVNINKRESRI